MRDTSIGDILFRLSESEKREVVLYRLLPHHHLLEVLLQNLHRTQAVFMPLALKFLTFRQQVKSIQLKEIK